MLGTHRQHDNKGPAFTCLHKGVILLLAHH